MTQEDGTVKDPEENYFPVFAQAHAAVMGAFARTLLQVARPDVDGEALQKTLALNVAAVLEERGADAQVRSMTEAFLSQLYWG